jgi:hypothetical protein
MNKINYFDLMTDKTLDKNEDTALPESESLPLITPS